MTFNGQQFLVIGLGVSGTSCVEFLLKRGAIVWGMDRDPARLQPLTEKGMLDLPDETSQLPSLEGIIVSPGVPPSHPTYRLGLSRGIPVIGEVELALRYAAQPILGITGTNGKTTVALLTTHLLNQNGIAARAVGNVGTPVTSQIDHHDEVLVLELSSYQLETLSSKVLSAAVILNITQDHLDRYANMEDYARAKCQIARCLRKNAPLYVEKKCWDDWGYLLRARKEITSQSETVRKLPRIDDRKSVNIRNMNRLTIVDPRGFGAVSDAEVISLRALSDEPRLLEASSHHQLNQLAAFHLVQQMGVTKMQAEKALHSFVIPSHRIEFVLCHLGVNYYDDSKGTNVDAVMKAVDTLTGGIILIAGGQAKGADFSPWLTHFVGKVKAIILIGEAKKEMQRLFSSQYQVEDCQNLAEAVSCASKLAKSGDNVLLSPGCASFDQFRDYHHRGELFKQYVHDL